ncbi:MAG: glycosyltransferase [Candidatus Omnitrophica bacterium]|nr:glycosyltransferase [Candidatus Omnitrophota bacterium]
MSSVYLSVIIPAYNEERNLSSTVKEVAAYLLKQDYSCELIIVDDGSRDNTLKIAEACRDIFKDLKIISYPMNRGKGFAVNKGIFEAQGDYILFMDADNSTSILEFEKFKPFLNTE